MSDKYRIRLAEFAELSLLKKLEDAAVTVFQYINYTLEVKQTSLSLGSSPKNYQLVVCQF